MSNLSDLNAELLKKIKQAGFYDGADLTPNEKERADFLTEQGLLAEEHRGVHSVGDESAGGDFYFGSLLVPEVRYGITPKGEDALITYDKDIRQQKFQNRTSVASVVIPAVTFLFGLVVEYSTGIVQLIVSLVST